MRPHRRQPTRFPCPWDSPSKNTGVGCHFLLQCMKKVKSAYLPTNLAMLYYTGYFRTHILGWWIKVSDDAEIENFDSVSLYPPTHLHTCIYTCIFSQLSVQSLSRVWLFATPWIAACQASLSVTKSWSSLKLTSIESVMPSSHLILCCPLLLLPPIPPSIRVFSNESTLHIRWPKYWSFSFSIIPSKEHLYITFNF